MIRRVLRHLSFRLTHMGVQLRTLDWRFTLGHLGPGSRVYPRAVVHSRHSVWIGSNVVVNDFVHIWGGGGVTIGNDSLLAAGVKIVTQTHQVDAGADGRLFRETNVSHPIVIGQNVWIGTNAAILPGVTIGDGAIVAAGAVVTRDVPDSTLVAGVPARVVRILK